MKVQTIHTGRVLAVTAALSTIMIATAQAAPVVRDMTIKAVTTQYDNPPHLVMEHDGSKYRLANKGESFGGKLRLTARGKGAKLVGGSVAASYNGNGGLWAWPAGYKTRKFEKTVSVTFGKAALGLFENYARNWCNSNGKNEKVVRHLSIPLRYNVWLYGPHKTIDGTYPGRIVCMAKKGPSRPRLSRSRRSSSIPFRPGRVNFTLVRKDGAKQNASLTTKKVNGGVAARWAKTYTFEKSVDRAYMVVVKGHKFSTSWVPMKLNCGVGNDHGTMGNLSGGRLLTH